jgi:tetratricopeptide (TPR) repeat protein
VCHGRARRPLRRLIKAAAQRNLARIAALRGRHEAALAFQESALALLGRRSSRSERRMLAYGCVVTLVNLDRVAEARVRFDTLPRALEGDYLRAQRAAAELYLAFGEGAHRFEPAFLREQADIAVTLPSARVLLGLLAWAQDQAGHPRIAAELLALARDRPGESHVRRLYPRLATWMDGRA